MAEMIAAQKFNQKAGLQINAIYGCVSTGLLWRFLKLEQKEITIDLRDHSIEPLDQLLGILTWMAIQGN